MPPLRLQPDAARAMGRDAWQRVFAAPRRGEEQTAQCQRRAGVAAAGSAATPSIALRLHSLTIKNICSIIP
jgi:hypothetical protein